MLTNDEIDDIVLRYRNKDSAAAIELLSAFQPYIDKWISLLVAGWINVQNREVAAFVSTLGQDSLYDVRVLLKSLTGRYTDLEVRDQLVLIFMDRLSRYRKIDGGPSFPGYLSNTFGHEVRRWLFSGRDDIVIYNEDVYERALRNAAAPDSAVPADAFLTDMDIIPDLTPRERNSLYLRYLVDPSVAKGKVKEIAHLLGCSESVVRDALRSGRGKARKWALENNYQLDFDY